MERPRRPSRRAAAILSFAVLVLLAVFLARSWWLAALGHALVRNDGPAKADIAVVLAGDYTGNRILEAAELVRRNYVPAVLVSGPGGFYGGNECDYAIAFAVRRGYPAAWFIPLPVRALSTRAEARAILTELRRRRIHSFLLVTSDFHTARAARLFRWAERSGGGPPFRTVAAADKYFRLDQWWREREGQKTVFMEWCKTLASAVGL